MRSLLALALLLSLPAAGCSDVEVGGGRSVERREARSSGGEDTDELEYGAEARAGYEAALLDFRDGDCLKAQPAFSSVRRKYPYSRFAALSELRIGDCQFEDKSYAEAIETFRAFVRNRPSHAQIPYARFRIAEAQYKQIPREWFLAPPAHQRDQTPVEEALRYLRRFVRDFPTDDRVPSAQRMITKTLKILAQHELYAARFYQNLDADRAAAERLKRSLRLYTGSGIEAETLLLLGEVHEDMGHPDAAREAYEKLLADFATSEEAPEARSRLARLR